MKYPSAIEIAPTPAKSTFVDYPTKVGFVMVEAIPWHRTPGQLSIAHKKPTSRYVFTCERLHCQDDKDYNKLRKTFRPQFNCGRNVDP